jgi:hypothetical protein
MVHFFYSEDKSKEIIYANSPHVSCYLLHDY